jgi:pimeloyl-ACP methyl ester carboxylesterase
MNLLARIRLDSRSSRHPYRAPWRKYLIDARVVFQHSSFRKITARVAKAARAVFLLRQIFSGGNNVNAPPAISDAIPINGMHMYYEIYGHGEPLLLLHGFLGIGDDWALIFKDLQPPEGYQFIVPDLRGHGRSTNPSMTFTHRQSALDVFALLDHLKIAQCKAIGMSCGAKTLLHMATQQPSRIDAMVLVSATSYFPKEARKLMAQITLEGKTEADWQLLPSRHRHGDAQIRALFAQGRAMKGSFEDVNFTPPLLSTITARTLLVHGDCDFYPVPIAAEMHQAIPKSYLAIIPNAGHGPIFGEHAAYFRQIALPFLRGQWEQKPPPSPLP